ncbi:MAG: bacillithiol biosynthesis cysteine-adding enzyme BshC, partial [Candidatus Kapaibacterium sp.]
MDIASLPYFTPLVRDYLTRFGTSPIRDFFAISPEAPHEQMREIIDARILRERALPPMHRTAVVAAIRSLHASLGPISGAAAHHLELLEQPETLAVVTGQQAGMLGGPLYTFYKAFTAIELSKSLAEQFPVFSFVPVFWIETEDHDLEEISSAHVLSSEGQLESIRYVPSQIAANPEQLWRRQAGPLALEEESLQQFFSGLTTSLAPTDFSAEVFELLRRCYTPGRSIAHAFASLFTHYFSTEGLLVIDANSRELKSLAKDLFRREIETSPQLSDRIVLTSEKLEETYHAQVKPRALNLFYVNEDGDRLPITERERTSGSAERSFFLKGSRKVFTLQELLDTLETHSERFSPNVVMRPLYQDSLLPTVAYVAGPGEMAYFAQFQPSYEWAGIPMPLIRPRVTNTLIEERLERLFT